MGKKEKIKLKMSYKGAVSLASDSNYDFMTALYELIDNSFASEATEVRVEVRTNQQNQVVYTKVTDNGKGLPKGEIETALAPGGEKGTGINEHGVGMKAAINHLGVLELMWSSTGSEEWSLDELNPDENDLAVEIDVSDTPSSESGMSVSITCNVEEKATYNLNSSSVSMTTKKLALGHRYADILDKPNKELIFEIKNQDGSKTKKSEKIESWHAEYDSMPVHNLELEGSNYTWKATLSIFKLKEKSGKFDPIKNGTGLGGIDIVMHGRCVVKRTKAPLVKILNAEDEPIKFSHPSYNRLYGRLIVDYGIKTTPKKDNIQENDPPFVELTQVLADTWAEKEVSKYFKEEDLDEITESQIEDNLMQLLEDDDYTDVEQQQEIGFGFRTDVQALKEDKRYVWEVKKGKGMVNDLLQLVNYIKITNSEKGILLADGFHGDVKKYATDHWSEYHIEYWDLNSMKYKGLKIKPAE